MIVRLPGMVVAEEKYVFCRIIFYGNYLWNEKNIVTLHRIS